MLETYPAVILFFFFNFWAADWNSCDSLYSCDSLLLELHLWVAACFLTVSTGLIQLLLYLPAIYRWVLDNSLTWHKIRSFHTYPRNKVLPKPIRLLCLIYMLIVSLTALSSCRWPICGREEGGWVASHLFGLTQPLGRGIHGSSRLSESAAVPLAVW